MTVTASMGEKRVALLIAEEVAHMYGRKEVGDRIVRLLRGDTDPQLPYLVWSGLRGLSTQQIVFEAWGFEIGQASTPAYRMVEKMTSGGSHATS